MRSIDSCQNQHKDAVTSVNMVNIRSINWREDLKKKRFVRGSTVIALLYANPLHFRLRSNFFDNKK